MRLFWYELRFPAGLTHETVVPWIRTLVARQRRGLFGGADAVIFETHSSGGELRWFLGASERERSALFGHLHTMLPGIRLGPGEARPALELGRAVEVRLNTTRRPLRLDAADSAAAALVSALHGTRKDERVVLQWMIGPWLPRPVVKRIGPMKPGLGVERLLLQLAMDAEDANAYRKKLGEPLLGTTLRIGVRAGDRPRQKQILQRVLGALQLARQPGVGLVARLLTSKAVLRRMRGLHRPLVAWPCPLNAAELAALLGWPLSNPSLPGLTYSGLRQLAPAPGTTISDVGRKPGDRVLGRAAYPGQSGLLMLRPADALLHAHVIGPTGVGKSTLLANLIEADIDAGRAVVVIEPKGDLVDHVLDRLPDHRLNDIVLLDPADEAFPVGLNVLACRPEEAELVVDQLVHVFRELYRDSWGPRTQDVLHAGLLTLARAGGQTLCELPVLLTNAGYRHRILDRVDDPLALGPFWGWFEALREGERTEVIGPVLNKLRAFTYRRAIRSILGQADARFTMRQVFTGRKVLLVNLAKGLVGPEAARLLGSLIFSSLWQAALGRAAVKPEKRHPVMVYVDEWQDFLRLPVDLGDALAQARGLGIGLHLAHQHLGQLTAAAKAAVLANARSRVVFQTSSSDAPALAGILGGGLEAEDLRALGRHEAYATIVCDSAPMPPASLATLPPTAQRSSADAAREASRRAYGKPVEQVEAELVARRQVPEADQRLGGRRRRSA